MWNWDLQGNLAQTESSSYDIQPAAHLSRCANGLAALGMFASLSHESPELSAVKPTFCPGETLTPRSPPRPLVPTIYFLSL